MCKSICKGTCSFTLNNAAIDSKESLVSVVDTLSKLTMCSPPNNKDEKDNRMNTLLELKMEAKNLLEEVTGYSENLRYGNNNNAFEDNSFKEKLKMLKEKIQSLEASFLKVN